MAGDINSSLIFSVKTNSSVLSHVKWEKNVEHLKICLQHLTLKVSIYLCLSLQGKSFLIGFASQRTISHYKSHSKFCTSKMMRSLWTKYLSFHISSLNDFITEVFPVTFLVIPQNTHHPPSPHSFHSKNNCFNDQPKAIKLTKSLILITARRSVCLCVCVSIVKCSMLKALEYLTISNVGLLVWAPVIQG